MNRTNEEPLYELEGISKSFGPVQALKDIALKVYKGEIIGLVGDNGAGKSTLIKILSGIYKPDQGTIRYKGEVKQVQSYRDSQGIGIATIYQDRALVDSVSIYRNIFMGSEIVNRLGLLDKRKMREDAARVLKQSISIGIQSPDLLVATSRAARSRRWPLPAPSTSAPSSCCSTSPPTPCRSRSRAR